MSKLLLSIPLCHVRLTEQTTAHEPNTALIGPRVVWQPNTAQYDWLTAKAALRAFLMPFNSFLKCFNYVRVVV